MKIQPGRRAGQQRPRRRRRRTSDPDAGADLRCRHFCAIVSAPSDGQSTVLLWLQCWFTDSAAQHRDPCIGAGLSADALV